MFSKGLLVVHGFNDADWAGNPDTGRSTGGFCIFFGSSPISWSSKKQSTIARSSTEAEYRSLDGSAAELSWICQLLKDLHIFIPMAPTLHCDNMSAISYSSNPVFHSRMKHKVVDYHFVRELVQAKVLQVSYICTLNQLADIFTKGLAAPRFAYLRHKLQILPSSTYNLSASNRTTVS